VAICRETKLMSEVLIGFALEKSGFGLRFIATGSAFLINAFPDEFEDFFLFFCCHNYIQTYGLVGC